MAAVYITPLLSGRRLFCRRARISTQMESAKLRQAMVIGKMFLGLSTMLVNSVALRLGAHYEIPASGFIWTSQDGIFTAINETAFSGGQLTPSGLGTGTTIVPLLNTDPNPSTVYQADEDA